MIPDRSNTRNARCDGCGQPLLTAMIGLGHGLATHPKVEIIGKTPVVTRGSGSMHSKARVVAVLTAYQGAISTWRAFCTIACLEQWVSDAERRCELAEGRAVLHPLRSPMSAF